MILLGVQLLHLFQYLSRSNEYFPITLGVLGLNIIAFFQPGHNWPSVRDACISVQGVLFQKQWKRIFLASFYHSSDFHLYYNMASFIWKAISLEKHFGSAYFLYMIAVFSVSTNLLYLAMNYALAEVLDQWSYIRSCAVGFSGVLFALKVVTTHLQPAGMTRVMGFIPVPMRLACWVELILISVLFPHVSFIGHLAGIIVGFAFIYGPLQIAMNIPLSLLTGTVKYVESVNLEGVLPDKYRSVVVAAVGVFMLLFPLLLDLIPTGAGTEQYHHGDGHSYTYRAAATGRLYVKCNTVSICAPAFSTPPFSSSSSLPLLVFLPPFPSLLLHSPSPLSSSCLPSFLLPPFVGRRAEPQPPRRPQQPTRPNTQPYHSYTYTSGVSGELLKLPYIECAECGALQLVVHFGPHNYVLLCLRAQPPSCIV